MNRGNGTIYQRGTTWWLAYWYRGQRRRESAHSARRADAVKLMRRRMGEMGMGRLVGPHAERVTAEDLFGMLRDDYIVNGRRSLKRAEVSLAHLRAFFGLAKALDITTDTLSGYVRARREHGAALATIQNELAALKRAFTLAIRAERLSHRPAFPILHIENARQGFLERADLDAVCAELPDALRPVVRFAYLTGWRKREILGLTWADVDMSAGIVRLDAARSKNKRGRVFPFGAMPELAALLTAQRDATSDVERRTGSIVRAVFHRNGKAITSYDVAWRSACQRAGVPGRLIHDCRRSAVRNLERAGVSRSVAMQLVGILTDSIYKRYAIVAEADLAEGVAKLAKLATEPQRRTILPLKQARG
jgi:integrase